MKQYSWRSVINGLSGSATGSNQSQVTFRAIAFKAGWNDSDEAEETCYYDAESQGMAQLQGEGSSGPLYDDNGNLVRYKTLTSQHRIVRIG